MKADTPGHGAILAENHPASTTRAIGLVVAVPGEVDGASAVPPSVPTVHPPVDSDEAKLTALALELDHSRPKEIDRLSVPEVHLRDAPLAGDVDLCCGSGLGSTRSTHPYATSDLLTVVRWVLEYGSSVLIGDLRRDHWVRSLQSAYPGSQYILPPASRRPLPPREGRPLFPRAVSWERLMPEDEGDTG